MLNRAYGLVFKHFSTFWLIAAVLVIPVQLGYNYAFRDVVGVGDLHSQIEGFPPGRRVAGVGPQDLDRARSTGRVVLGVEMIAALILVRACRRVVSTDARGQLPTVVDAYRGLLGPSDLRGLASRSFGGVIVGLTVAATVGILINWSGTLAIEPLSRSSVWIGAGLVKGVSLATAAPFVLVPLALIRLGR